MPEKTPTQRRTDRAEAQRDQKRSHQTRGQRQTPQPQSTEALQQQSRGQVAQSQPSQPQQQLPPLSMSERLSREASLTPALQDLQKYYLISEQEAEKIRKEHDLTRVIQELDRSFLQGATQEQFQEETAQQEFLTSVSERLQAFLNDDQKLSKHRRQVRRAKEVIGYHQDFRSRYRASQLLRRDEAQGVQQQQGPLRASQVQTAEQQLHRASTTGASATLPHPLQPRQQDDQASRRLGPPSTPQRQSQLRPAQGECLRYLLMCGSKFRSLLEEMKSLGILSREDIDRLPPPDSGTDWIVMMETLESRIKTHHRAGSRSARRHPQTVNALRLIADLKDLFADDPEEELEKRRGQQLQTAAQDIQSRREAEGLNPGPTSVEQTVRELPARALCDLACLLKSFQSFGLFTPRELREIHVPSTASEYGRLMDRLHKKAEAYRLGGGGDGDGRRSAEDLEKLSELQSRVVVFRLRYRS